MSKMKVVKQIEYTAFYREVLLIVYRNLR